MTSAISNQPPGVLPEQNAKAGQVQDASADTTTRAAAADKVASAPKDTVSISTEAKARHAETQASSSAQSTTASTSTASTASAASSAAEAAASASSDITSTKIDNLTKEIEALKKDMNGTGGEERAELNRELKQKEAELKRLEDQAAAAAS